MVTVAVTGHSSRRSTPPRWAPTGDGLHRGQLCWPPLGRTVGRQRATTWPPLGRISWPPTGGYLGAFSYNSHDRFWLENCDLPVDTGSFAGTTRACFEETLYQANARDQASALRAILEDYPPRDEPDPDHRKFRSPTLHREILSWISRLETGQVAVEVDIEPHRVSRRLFGLSLSLVA